MRYEDWLKQYNSSEPDNPSKDIHKQTRAKTKKRKKSRREYLDEGLGYKEQL